MSNISSKSTFVIALLERAHALLTKRVKADAEDAALELRDSFQRIIDSMALDMGSDPVHFECEILKTGKPPYTRPVFQMSLSMNLGEDIDDAVQQRALDELQKFVSPIFKPYADAKHGVLFNKVPGDGMCTLDVLVDPTKMSDQVLKSKLDPIRKKMEEISQRHGLME